MLIGLFIIYFIVMVIIVPVIKLIFSIFDIVKYHEYCNGDRNIYNTAPKKSKRSKKKTVHRKDSCNSIREYNSVYNRKAYRMTDEEQKQYNELRDIRDKIMSFGINGLNRRDKKKLKKYNIL